MWFPGGGTAGIAAGLPSEACRVVSWPGVRVSNGPARPSNWASVARHRWAVATGAGSSQAGSRNRGTTVVGLLVAAGKWAESSAFPAAESEPPGAVSQLTQQAAQLQDSAALARAEAARTRIAEYDAEIGQYRASLKAGADPAVIGPWIAETQAKKVAAQAEIRTATGRHQMSQDEIAAIVTALGDLARVVSRADPADKSEIYAQLGLALTYQPGERLVRATLRPGRNMRKGFVSEDQCLPIAHVADIALTTAFRLCGSG